MNAKEISELKKRFNPDKRNGTLLRGCYVRYDGTYISSFQEKIGMLSDEEMTQYCTLFKKVLSGSLNQHLLPIDFTTEDVQNSEKHAALMDALSTEIADDEAAQALFEVLIGYLQGLPQAKTQSITEQQNLPNYLILLMHDTWDIPARDRNGDIDRENSANVFRYLIGCICPVKQGKPALTYSSADSLFRARLADWTVASPQSGFLFPAFEEGGANLYRAMYYTASTDTSEDTFVRDVFGVVPPMSSEEQRASFQSILEESLDDECTLQTVQSVHETVRGLIEEQKAEKTAEPLALTAAEAGKVLESCGVAPEKVEAFESKYRDTFGDYAQVPATNLLMTKQYKVDVPNISIRVSPEHSDMIQTRWLEGRAYLLIPVEGDIEVNGMKIREVEPEPAEAES